MITGDFNSGFKAMRILSYNIQATINSTSYLSYFLHGYRQFFPGSAKHQTLCRIGAFIREFDMVCLQEIDSGGFRNGFLNHAEQFSVLSGMPYYLAQTNRRIGKLSLHGNVILSKIPIHTVLNAPLPAKIPGRGVLAVAVKYASATLVVVNLHLSLGIKDQCEQLRFVCQALEAYPDVLIVGDFNCVADALPLQILSNAGYRRLGENRPTFPGWKPQKALDHALLKGNLPGKAQVSPFLSSDHLPIIVELGHV